MYIYANLDIYIMFRSLEVAHFERFFGGVQVEEMLHGVGHVVPRGYLFRGPFGNSQGIWGAQRRPSLGVLGA